MERVEWVVRAIKPQVEAVEFAIEAVVGKQVAVTDRQEDTS
jgi:hypothetical protein